jgi:hypothetical protein
MRAGTDGFTTVACVVLVALLAGCRSRVSTEVAVDQIDVVDQPYPPNYPSTNAINLRTIATIYRRDRVYVCDQEAEKDYMYYMVELPSGQRGYVIFSGEWPFRQHNFYEYAK